MSFARAVAFVLLPQNDGQPYHVTENDPGGATAFGWALRENPDLTDADLRAMTPQSSAQRFERTFWVEIKGYQLPEALHVVMLDTAVVEGSPAAIRFLQAALYVSVDGVLGPGTLQAASRANGAATVQRFTGERLFHLSQKYGWLEFGKGWASRAIAAAMEPISP